MIKLERVGFIARIIINRPESRNALSLASLEKLCALLIDIKNQKDIRAVIFTGAGDKSFCAGADLKERSSMNEEQALSCVQKIQSTLQQIASLPMPTIAAINAGAYGGGLELALACDLRVASASAFMGLTECALGIIPGAGGTKRLPKIVGLTKALELIFLAKKISANEAVNIGLVNMIAEDSEQTKKLAMTIAKQIAANAPLAIRAAKVSVYSAIFKEIEQDLEDEFLNYQKVLKTTDRVEGLNAFREKRAPNYLGE